MSTLTYMRKRGRMGDVFPTQAFYKSRALDPRVELSAREKREFDQPSYGRSNQEETVYEPLPRTQQPSWKPYRPQKYKVEHDRTDTDDVDINDEPFDDLLRELTSNASASSHSTGIEKSASVTAATKRQPYSSLTLPSARPLPPASQTPLKSAPLSDIEFPGNESREEAEREARRGYAVAPPPPPPPHQPALASSSSSSSSASSRRAEAEAEIAAAEAAEQAARIEILEEQQIDDIFSGEIWDEILADNDQLVQVYREQNEENEKLITGMNYYEGIMCRLNEKRKKIKGDMIYREFMDNFAQFRVYRYGPQMDVIRACVGALIPQMFGDSFETHKERITREYGITDFRQQVLASMPRRCGKSKVAAMIEANCLYTFGGLCAVFAAYFFQSKELKGMIHEFVCQLPGGREMCVINNQKVLMVSKFKDKNDRTAGLLHAFAGKVNSARGFTAHRIYYDEASFADANFITSNVFAGMLLDKTFVFLISSPPDGSNNVFNQLCHALDVRGRPVYKWIRVEGMCPKCSQEKKTNCPHISFPKPPWHASAEQLKTIELVMSKIDPRRYRIEIKGIAETTDTDAFPRDNVQKFMELDRLHFGRAPEFIAIAVDPSGDGESDTGLAAMALDERGRTVVRILLLFLSFALSCLLARGESGMKERVSLLGFVSNACIAKIVVMREVHLTHRPNEMHECWIFTVLRQTHCGCGGGRRGWLARLFSGWIGQLRCAQ